MRESSTEVIVQGQVNELAHPAKGGTLPWCLAARIAWRESRASLGRFAFIVAAVAVGVAALVGVRGFSTLFRDVLLKEARTLMAADLSVRDFRIPTAAQWAVVEELEASGVKRTWVTESVSMLSAGPDTVPVLVSVKAIDPEVYPFYGEFKASVPGTLREILQPDSILVAPDIMIRFDLEPGDTIRLGSATFRIAGAVDNEPDRMTGSLNAGPRVMMSRAGLERTGLITEGSRAAQRLLFRFPDPQPGTPTVDVQQVRDRSRKPSPTP